MNVNTLFDFVFSKDTNSFFFKIGSLRKIYSKDPFHAVLEAKKILYKVHHPWQTELEKALENFNKGYKKMPTIPEIEDIWIKKEHENLPWKKYMDEQKAIMKWDKEVMIDENKNTREDIGELFKNPFGGSEKVRNG